MKRKAKFRVGDYVRIRGYNNRAHIHSFCESLAAGAVRLDKRIAGFAFWNVEDLILISRVKRSRGGK